MQWWSVQILKDKFSISVDEDLLLWLDSQIKKKRFASRSHGVEYALNELKEKSWHKTIFWDYNSILDVTCTREFLRNFYLLYLPSWCLMAAYVYLYTVGFDQQHSIFQIHISHANLAGDT